MLIQGVPIDCINQAAVTYYVPAKVIIAVLAVEGGRVGTASRNKNGTVDLGPMQINSSWLKTLAPYGYTRQKLQYDGCANISAGTWILSKRIAHASTYWQGVGDYHSYTAHLNQNYQKKVAVNYQLLVRYLNAS